VLPITVLPVCHARADGPMLEQCSRAHHRSYMRIKGCNTEPSGTKRDARQKPHALSDNKHCSRAVRHSPSAVSVCRSILNAENPLIG
jgi:hypothetical protein